MLPAPMMVIFIDNSFSVNFLSNLVLFQKIEQESCYFVPRKEVGESPNFSEKVISSPTILPVRLVTVYLG